jgi:hypothetical protein
VRPGGDWVQREPPLVPPPPHGLPLIMALGGLEPVDLLELLRADFHHDAVEVAWSVWSEQPAAFSRLVYSGIPFSAAPLSTSDFVRLLHPGCAAAGLEDAVLGELREQERRAVARGRSFRTPLKPNPDWEAAAEVVLDALVGFRPASSPLASEVVAARRLARFLGAPASDLLSSATRGTKRWLRQGSFKSGGVPWGDVWRQRVRWAPGVARAAATPMLPRLPYAVPAGPGDRVDVPGAPGLQVLSSDGRARLLGTLRTHLAPLASVGAHTGGTVFEAAAAIAICDAADGLAVRVYSTRDKLGGIELDLLLVGPNDRMVLIEVKSNACLPDDRMAKARKAAGARAPTAAGGKVGAQQHNAQLEVAQRLLGGAPRTILYALPGHIKPAEVEGIERLKGATVLPSWGSRADVRSCIAGALGL